MTSVDTDLKSFQCVDFRLTDSETILELELNSGEITRKVIDVMKLPQDTAGSATCDSGVMSMDELSCMDDIEFLLNKFDLPGVLLKKGDQVTWSPIASRTRSKLSGSSYANFLMSCHAWVLVTSFVTALLY